MMKKTAFPLLVILLGVALGFGVAQFRLRSAVWDPQSVQSVEAPPQKNTGPSPKVVVDRADFEFGTLDMTGRGVHDFVLTNRGDATLVLAKGETSCRCAVSELAHEKVLPGESTKVRLTWKPTDESGPYRQTAVILTNDPDRPRVTLTVSGEIVVAARFAPSSLVFSRLTPDQSTSGSVRLFGYAEEPLRVLDQSWASADTASYFEANLQPLSDEEIKAEPNAHSGLLVRVTIKPGLPPGAVRQELVLKTNLKSASKQTLPIEGMVGGEIAVVGPGWNPNTNVLNLGQVPRHEGARRQLLLVVRGTNRKNVQFQVAEVTPATLKATLGPRREINHGAVVQFPLTISVPPDGPPANHLGSQQGRYGEVLLKTTHPNVPRVRILVRFAVEG
ncbi:MAG: DUF1573 domain-containing protein [Planctomycetaceae bacterium]|nr:DUF1573 domain-containing protein [Planctomycetaceae bacterium]